MTYNLGIPAASNTPAHDQPLMQQNFAQIATSYNTDHVPLNSGSNAGFSNRITLVDQASGPGSAASQVVQYAKSVVYPNAAGTFSELFFQRDGVGTEIQMTAGPGNPVAALAGQTYLPGGIILQWGRTTNTTGSSQGSLSVSFPNAFPTALFNIQAISGGPGIFVYIATAGFSRTGFTANFQGNIPNGNWFYWTAIGN